MPARPSDPLAELADLLGEERNALVSGDLDALAPLAARKETLVAALEASGPQGDALQRIAEAARFNQSLIEAARGAVAAVRAQLDVLRNGGPALSTYDAAGRAQSHGPARPTLERRA